MIDYSTAIEIISAAAVPLAPEETPLGASCGAAVATDIASAVDVPAFANSAMDGYAVRASDSTAATPKAPVDLVILGSILAGTGPPVDPTAPGSAWEIMTGAALPEACDSVIPLENVELIDRESGQAGVIRIREPVPPGLHIRRAGEDFAVGQSALTAGQDIGPEAVMGLAAMGVEKSLIQPMPRVAVITTGSELTASEGALQPGMIRDANGPYLIAALRRLGIAATTAHRVGDNASDFQEQIATLEHSVDVILTTGGVSMSRMDFVPTALADLGADILFHRVAIRPGKPILFARLPTGTLAFGLPGNPIAVAVGLRFFVIAALRRLQGRVAEQFHWATSKTRLEKKKSLRFFAKGRAEVDSEGQIMVEILPGQESFKISPLMEANCWAVIEENCTSVTPGQLVQVAPLYPSRFLQPS